VAREGSHDCPSGWLSDLVAGVGGRRANALPQNASGSPGEGHTQILEVLEDRTKCAEEIDAENEIKTTKVDARNN
jgi:hypothetical protein